MPAKRRRGEHIHHGYFLEPTDTKERAQKRLVELLLERSDLRHGSSVLDVGCGVGGTSRHLSYKHGCEVTGITISGRQVAIAQRETESQRKAHRHAKSTKDNGLVSLSPGNPQGEVRFLELDAEKMGDFFTTTPNATSFDCVWISEAMSHLPDKKLFFDNAHKLLEPGGKLVVSDWFKAEGLTDAQEVADIKPIEGTLDPSLVRRCSS